MDKYTDEEIKTIIAAYDQKRTREKRNYDMLKDDEEFKKQNRERVRKWYLDNKQYRQKEYLENKEFRTARSCYLIIIILMNKNHLCQPILHILLLLLLLLLLQHFQCH